MSIEGLPRQTGELTEQQRAAIAADAPELEALLHELREGLEEIRTRLAPLLKEVGPSSLARTCCKLWRVANALLSVKPCWPC